MQKKFRFQKTAKRARSKNKMKITGNPREYDNTSVFLEK